MHGAGRKHDRSLPWSRLLDGAVRLMPARAGQAVNKWLSDRRDERAFQRCLDTNRSADEPIALWQTAPSRLHEAACRRLLYRLSELAFGSLLAGYVLGFSTSVAFIQKDVGGLLEALSVLTVAAISGTYAVLTGAMYLQYHFNILSMPTGTRSGWDSTIAFSQALFFGISIGYPPFHPLFVGLAVLLGAWRQNSEVRSLASLVARDIMRGPARLQDGCGVGNRGDRKTLKRVARDVRKDMKAVKIWEPIKPQYWGWLALAFIVGAVVAWFSFSEHGDTAAIIQTGAAVLIFLVAASYGRSTLKLGWHAGLDSGNVFEELDRKFSCLQVLANERRYEIQHHE
jgi:hypothetical protein